MSVRVCVYTFTQPYSGEMILYVIVNIYAKIAVSLVDNKSCLTVATRHTIATFTLLSIK